MRKRVLFFVVAVSVLSGSLFVSTDNLFAPTRRAELDHVGAYNFTVEVNGVAVGYFSGVDGMSMEMTVL